MIPAKFATFRTNRFEIIALFVNVILAFAAISIFSKFHFWPKNSLRAAETKLGFSKLKIFDHILSLLFMIFAKFGPLGLTVLMLLQYYQISIGGWRPSWILQNFIFDRLRGAEMKLGLKFGNNRANGFRVIEF